MRVQMIVALIGFLLVLVAVGAFQQKLGKYVIVYELSGERFNIRLLNLLPLFSVRYKDISEVRAISLKETFGLGFFALRMGNRMFGKIVLIRKPKGLIREILISPKDHEAFIREISKHLVTSR